MIVLAGKRHEDYQEIRGKSIRWMRGAIPEILEEDRKSQA